MVIELRDFIRFCKRRPLFVIGMVIVTIALLLAVFPEQIAPFPPQEAVAGQYLLPPGRTHWFGTDINGMDIFSRIIWGARIDMTIAIAAAIGSITIGITMGAWVGFYSDRPGLAGLVSTGTLRLLDVLQAIPVFIMGLALVAALGRKIYSLIYVLIFLNVPIFVRLTRSSVLSVREATFIEAARCSGNSELRLILRHIMPNSLTPALINASVICGFAILLTAGLSFVGAGVPAPTPEWGYMVSVGAPNMVTGQWWPAFFPGVTIGIVVLGFALVGDGLREYFSPRKDI